MTEKWEKLSSGWILVRKWLVITGQREFILKLSQNGRRSAVPSFFCFVKRSARRWTRPRKRKENFFYCTRSVLRIRLIRNQNRCRAKNPPSRSSLLELSPNTSMTARTFQPLNLITKHLFRTALIV